MESYIQYIENALKNVPETPSLYKYKRQLLDKMTERANEITRSGMKDKNVLSELIISEYPDLPGDYFKFQKEDTKKERQRKNLIVNVIGSVLYVLSLIIVYLIISFISKDWRHTWLLIEGGISLWITYLLALGIAKITSMRRIFHVAARILLGIAVMVVAQAVFLVCMALLEIPDSWLIIILGIIGIFVADAIYTTVTKQKMAIINYLIYIPAVSPMLYIIFGVLGILPWSTGWVIVPLAVLVDIVIIAAKLIHNKKYTYKLEEEE